MATKSEGLSFPSDPLAALRALQDLDAPAAPPTGSTPGPPAGREPAPAPPVGDATAPPSAPTTGSEAGGATRSAAARKPAARRERGAPDDEEGRPQDAPDPLGDAVRQLLARPYAAEGAKAPVTVSTVKIPTEVWERLGWVAAQTGRTKQDLIAEALKDYFRGVLKDR